MKTLGWMAWTWQTAAFFCFIAACLITMFIWELIKPGGSPRQGALGLNTTRGDRLFVSLLGSAYIHVAWLGLTDLPLWWGSVVSVAFALAVFRWV